jgi:hypothetical protein
MSARISVEVARSPQGAEVSWKTHPGAARYVVRVAASDGMEVWKAETPEPRIRVSPEALAASPPGKSLVVEVEAIDALGRVIATSEPVPLP